MLKLELGLGLPPKCGPSPFPVLMQSRPVLGPGLLRFPTGSALWVCRHQVLVPHMETVE